MNYLFDYFNNDEWDGDNAIDSILSGYKMSVNESFSHEYEEEINSMLYIDIQDDGCGGWILSEFPGNCSSIVVHRIESKDRDVRERIFRAARHIAGELDYALIFISGTSHRMFEHATEFGFKPVLTEILNPHSGSENYFMVYHMEED